MNIIDVLTSPWAIMPDKLEEITGIYSTHLRGDKIDIAAIEAAHGSQFNNDDRGFDVIDGAAIIPVRGVLAKRMNLFSRISGGASTQLIQQDFLNALADDSVTSIVLHVDTPGGAVDGTAELAATIFESRGQKPIIALVDGLMASAGVWIGTAADVVLITNKTDIVGSIGVVTQHIDKSERERKMGIKVTEIFSGKFKRIASDHEPLTEEGREVIQAHLDYFYTIFVETVAEHRGVTVNDVLARMADGRSFIGQQAIDAGLVDGVSTLSSLTAALSKPDALNQLLPNLAAATNDSAGTAEAVDLNAESSGDDDEVSKTECSIMNLKDLKEQHPDTAAEAKQEGHDEGVSVGLDEGRKEGAETELKRIQMVLAQSMPGHEKLINTLMFDGETTGEQAAVAVLNAERDNRKASATDRQSDADEIGEVDASLDDGNNAESASTLTGDAKVKADWDASAELQAEFGNEFDRYAAYIKNAPRTKILGRDI